MEWLFYAGVALVFVVGTIGYVAIQQRTAQKEFGDDNPAQNRLSHILETYIRSPQDAAAYQAFSQAVRREFEVIGVASQARVRHRLMHASGISMARIKRGGKKPTAAQVRGAAEAIIRLSEEI